MLSKACPELPCQHHAAPTPASGPCPFQYCASESSDHLCQAAQNVMAYNGKYCSIDWVSRSYYELCYRRLQNLSSPMQIAHEEGALHIQQRKTMQYLQLRRCLRRLHQQISFQLLRGLKICAGRSRHWAGAVVWPPDPSATALLILQEGWAPTCAHVFYA